MNRLDGLRRQWAAEDPLIRMARLLREEFGEEEAQRLLRLSLTRIPDPGAREGAYIAALRAVLRAEKPDWAAANLKAEADYAD